jgi:hypothetical protein
LRAQIQALEDKKHKTVADNSKIGALKKELAPIQKFLSEAKQQRDSILKEIGMCSHDIFLV